MFPRALPLFLLATLATFAFLGFAPSAGHANPASFALFGRIFPNPGGWGSTSTNIMTPGPSLTVVAGESVTLSLTSVDGASHNWGVDYNNNQFSDSGEPVSPIFISSTTPTSYTFTATTTPGMYTYYCFVHHGPMVGNFIVQDFSISANPASVGPLDVGAQGTSTITISQLSGFSGTVDLSTSASPGLTASVNPTSIGGGSGTSTLTVSASAAGFYAVNVTGTSGILSHRVTVIVNVAQPDFSIDASPTSVGPLTVGVQGTSTITISSFNGFSGTVDLTTSPSTGLSASVNPVSVMSGSGASTLTVSAASGGSYSVVVTGTSGLLSHQVTVSVSVLGPDFSITADPANIGQIGTGVNGTSTINLAGLNGFAGTVSLTVSVSPSGLVASLSASFAPVAPGNGNVVVLSVSGDVAGNYTVRVTGTSGSKSHFVDVTVTVTPQNTLSDGNTSLYYVAGGVAAVVGAAAAAVFLFRRGRAKKH